MRDYLTHWTWTWALFIITTLYREPMERLAFDNKRPEDISGEAYIQSSNVNVHVLLNL